MLRKNIMKIERLQELKQKLTKEADLSKIWLFYMDNFADHPQFADLGHPARNDYLEAVVQKTCQQIFSKAIFSKPVKITNFFLIHIPKYKLFHGPFQAEGRRGGLIYFEDIKTGLLSVSDKFPFTNTVQYSRFSQVAKLPSTNRSDLN